MSTQTVQRPARDLEALRISRSPAVEGRPRRALLVVFVVVGAFALLAGAAHAVYSHTFGRPLAVQTLTVTATPAGSSGVVLTGSGYVVTRHKYITIGTKVLGQIVDEPIEEGQHVRVGELLARIDDRDYQAQVRQAQADRDLAEANGRLSSARASRLRELYRNGIASEDDLDVAETAAETARATLRRAEAALEYARFMVGQCVITSPIAGVVLKKYRELGDTINYGGPVQAGGGATDIAQLADTGDTRAEIDVNEVDIGKLAVGMTASVVPNAYPDRRFEASLAKVYPEADRQKGTVKVEVRLRDADLGIVKPEMSVRVSFLDRSGAAKEASPITVPKKALTTEANGAYVWKVQAGVARRSPVLAGRELEGGVEVRQGVDAGDAIIVAPPSELKDGQRVIAEHEG